MMAMMTMMSNELTTIIDHVHSRKEVFHGNYDVVIQTTLLYCDCVVLQC